MGLLDVGTQKFVTGIGDPRFLQNCGNRRWNHGSLQDQQIVIRNSEKERAYLGKPARLKTKSTWLQALTTFGLLVIAICCFAPRMLPLLVNKPAFASHSRFAGIESPTNRSACTLPLSRGAKRRELPGVTEKTSTGTLRSESTYRYDVLGRRVEKIENGRVTKTLYDGDNAWIDADSANNVKTWYLFGDSQYDENNARYDVAGGAAWYLADKLGSITTVVNMQHTFVASAYYDSFSNILATTNAATLDRFAFAGRELDLTGLYHNRARAYNPATGVFIQQDPLGFEGRDANLYRYTSNAGLNAADPSGETAVVEYWRTLKHASKTRNIALLGRCAPLLFWEVANILQYNRFTPGLRNIQGFLRAEIKKAVDSVLPVLGITCTKPPTPNQLPKFDGRNSSPAFAREGI